MDSATPRIEDMASNDCISSQMLRPSDLVTASKDKRYIKTT
jgi:hypothetical protein